MYKLFVGLDSVSVYIDDLLHVTKGSCTEHITFFEDMFTRLQKDGLKVNASKSCFGAQNVDYLVYQVTRDGFMTIPNKVEGMQALVVPKTCKQWLQFIGMINLYRDMWKKAL